MRAFRCFAILALCASLLVGGGAVAATPATTPEQDAAAAIQSLQVGQEVVLDNVIVARTAEGLVVDVVQREPLIYTAADIHTAASFCGVALASAIFGIGAGILGVIAASTGGTGTVILAGYVFTGAQVGVLAGLSGSYAALLAWISRFIC